MRFQLGTTNPSKVQEIASILAATGCEFAVTEPVDPEETEADFEGNALLKARAYAKAAGGLTISEDSGLLVPALGGLPGPWSARFADCELDGHRVVRVVRSGRPREEMDRLNTARVLELLKGVEQPRRAAAFKVVLAVATPDGAILFRSAADSHGWIADAPRGERGFGYDPIFVGGDTFGKTYAELDPMRKNLRSHRSRALKEFKAWLGRFLKSPRVVVDGNDGTGKSTVVARLRALGWNVADRGAPTKMTDDPSVKPAEGEVTLILDCPVETCRERLAKAGKNLDEKYHTVADLGHYRRRFLEVAKGLPRCEVVDAAGTPDQVVAACLAALGRIVG
jgi:XTP/dITP diphosphohydrolase